MLTSLHSPLLSLINSCSYHIIRLASLPTGPTFLAPGCSFQADKLKAEGATDVRTVTSRDMRNSEEFNPEDLPVEVHNVLSRIVGISMLSELLLYPMRGEPKVTELSQDLEKKEENEEDAGDLLRGIKGPKRQALRVWLDDQPAILDMSSMVSVRGKENQTLCPFRLRLLEGFASTRDRSLLTIYYSVYSLVPFFLARLTLYRESTQDLQLFELGSKS